MNDPEIERQDNDTGMPDNNKTSAQMAGVIQCQLDFTDEESTYNDMREELPEGEQILLDGLRDDRKQWRFPTKEDALAVARLRQGRSRRQNPTWDPYSLNKIVHGRRWCPKA